MQPKLDKGRPYTLVHTAEGPMYEQDDMLFDAAGNLLAKAEPDLAPEPSP